QIDDINAEVYDTINNGVYKAGFATRQPAYDDAVSALFTGLDRLEQRLGRQRYLVGNRLTEADLRLWTTLARFDAVYHTHFKCDRRKISEYPNLYGFLRDLYQHAGIADTLNMNHIRHHYFCSHSSINPHGIISIGPVQDWSAAHDRLSRFE
ncbi:MAG: glutathione S-transferase C-terminal domain-containing protein, partial [Oceanisphaera sp.]|nr:glutathione S-transferase C-terminal domain-containing protein [Oceanisphaera sp.]